MSGRWGRSLTPNEYVIRREMGRSLNDVLAGIAKASGEKSRTTTTEASMAILQGPATLEAARQNYYTKARTIWSSVPKL